MLQVFNSLQEFVGMLHGLQTCLAELKAYEENFEFFHRSPGKIPSLLRQICG